MAMLFMDLIFHMVTVLKEVISIGTQMMGHEKMNIYSIYGHVLPSNSNSTSYDYWVWSISMTPSFSNYNWPHLQETYLKQGMFVLQLLYLPQL
jgi:hypothetical protein